MRNVRAKKQLGQHFLKDLEIAQQIAGTLQGIVPADDNQKIRVLEIGSGMGVLTQFLIQNPAYETSAIEIDRESVAYLRDRFRNELDHNLRLIEGDFLKLNLNELYPEGQFCVIGNYRTTSLRKYSSKYLTIKTVFPFVRE